MGKQGTYQRSLMGLVDMGTFNIEHDSSVTLNPFSDSYCFYTGAFEGSAPFLRTLLMQKYFAKVKVLLILPSLYGFLHS